VDSEVVKEGGWIDSGRINSGYLDGKIDSGWTDS
jgi:hypothetical protein